MGRPIINPTTLLYCAISDNQWRFIPCSSPTQRLTACGKGSEGADHGRQHLLAIGYLLLPNRSVLVDPLTLKEAVMHHAHSEEQNKEKENHHE